MNPGINRKQWERARRKAKERDGWRCTVDGCGSMRSIEVDHIKPVADGGLKSMTCCQICLRTVGFVIGKRHALKTLLSIPEQDRLREVLERVLTEPV